MPVSDLQEIHSGRDFNTDTEVSSYTRVFMAKTTLRHDEGFVVQEFTESTGIQVGAVHHKDSEAICNAIRGSNSSGPFIWVITVGYSTNVTITDNPIDDPVDIAWDDVFRSELTQETQVGWSMTNSAGDSFDKPISVEVGTKAVTLKFNIAGDVDLPEWIFGLSSAGVVGGATGNGRHTLNLDPVIVDTRTCDASTLRFERASVGLVKTRNKIRFREVNCRLGYNPATWKIERLDEGFRERENGLTSGSGDPFVPIRQSDGTLPSKPLALDGNGKVLVNVGESTMSFRTFILYQSRDFTVVKGIDVVPPTP